MLIRPAALLLAASVIASSQDILVSAAVSLSEAVQEIVEVYRASGGPEVRVNLAASNVLARQIVNGAPVDVFISADEAQMDVVAGQGLVAAGSRRAIASNQLVVVAPPDRAAAVREAFPAAGTAIRRLALGDPAAVPAGVYARQYLETRGLWNAFAARVLPLGNVRAALAAVRSGGADAAIVYRTDVPRDAAVAIAIEIPVSDTPRIAYHAAVVRTTRDAQAAARFLAFLSGPHGQEILSRHGFLPPPGGASTR